MWFARVAVVSVLLSLPFVGGAEQSKSTNVRLHDIVVTGTKTPEQLKNTVDKVYLIKKTDIQKMGASDLREVLQMVPGVNMVKHSSTYVQMNGLSGDFVKILLDGVPISSRSLRGSPLESIPLSEIVRIEIIKGASSSLFGSEAIGGVINIITKRKSQKNGTDVSVDGTLYSNQKWSSRVLLSHKNKQMALRLQGGYKQDDGRTIKKVFGVQERTIYEIPKFNRKNIRMDLRYWGLGGLTLDLSGAYSVFDRTSSPNNEFWNNTFDERVDLNLKFNYKLDPLLVLDGYLAYRYFSHELSQYNLVFGTDIASQPTKYGDIEGELKFNWKPDRVQHIIGGINILNEKIDSETVQGERTRNNYAAFVQDKIHIKGLGELFLVGGLRLTHNEGYGDDISPRLSLRYHFSKKVSLRASYGQGYKAPTFKNNYFVFFHAAPANFLLLGNPNLKPEKSHSVNLSLHYAPSQRAKIEVTGFYNKLKNLITSVVTSTNSGVYNGTPYDHMRLYVNKEEAYTTGLETGVHLQPFESLKINLGYTFLIAEYKEDGSSYQELELRSKHSVKFAADFRPWSGTSFNLSGVWNSKQLLDSSTGERSPAYFMVSLNVRHFFSRNFELYGGIKNLLHNKEAYFGLYDGMTLYTGVRVKFANIF